MGGPERSTAFHVALTWVLSCLLATFIFGDLLWSHRVSHLRFQDLECDYMGLFVFLSNLWNGGPQLWNSYDQIPLMLNHNVGGMYSIGQTFVVLLYPLFKWLSPTTGEAFLAAGSTVAFYLYLLLVTAGLVLLVERFSKRTGVILLSSVVGATLLSGPLFMGVGGRHVVFLYPLLAHFILRSFETLNPRDFSAAAIVMLLSVYMSPFVTLGYFYQGVHFLLLAAFAWSWFRREDPLRQRLFQRQTWTLSRRDWTLAGALALLCLFVAIPLVWEYLATKSAYAFGEEHARTQNVFSLIEYFRRPFFFVPPRDFLYQSLNWTRIDAWWVSWGFLGGGVAVFATLGVVLGRDPRRHVFTAAVALLIMINAPRIPEAISDLPGFVAHLINALTNPGKSLVRSYHEPAAFAIPYFLVPLVACGLDAVCDVLDGLRPRLRIPSLAEVVSWRGGLAVVIALFASFSIYKNLGNLRSDKSLLLVLACSAVCAGVVMAVLFMRRRPGASGPRTAAFTFILALFALDAFNLTLGKDGFYGQIGAGAFTFAGAHDTLPAGLDFQNPEIMPFRRHLRADKVGQVPNPIIVNSINQQGVFYRYQNMHKYFQPLKQMSDARHSSFRFLSEVPEARAYFSGDQRIVFGAPLAVAEGPGTFSDLVKRGWQRSVVALDAEGLAEGGTFRRDLPAAAPKAFRPEELRFQRLGLDLGRAAVTRGSQSDLFMLDLPEGFPKQLATTPFTEDRRSLALAVGGRTLVPVQGKPLVPFTFDVQNLSTRKVAIALPPGSPGGQEAVLSYAAESAHGLTRVLRYDADNLEFEYVAEGAGWVVFHYPFDPKFEAYVDGAKAKIRRANTGFMAIEVGPGRHEIALRYWPGTPLRPWLLLAYVAALLAFFAVLAGAIRQGRSPGPA